MKGMVDIKSARSAVGRVPGWSRDAGARDHIPAEKN
jgi:hypothetical protein